MVDDPESSRMLFLKGYQVTNKHQRNDPVCCHEGCQQPPKNISKQPSVALCEGLPTATGKTTTANLCVVLGRGVKTTSIVSSCSVPPASWFDGDVPFAR